VTSPPFDAAHAESIFRREGLPTLVRGGPVLPRALPFLLAVSVVMSAWGVALPLGPLAYLLPLVIATVLVAVVVAGRHRLLRALAYPLAFSWPVTAGMTSTTAGSPLGFLTGDRTDFLRLAGLCVATTAAATLITWFGVLRLLSLARRDIVSFAGRGVAGQALTLPILAVLTLFFYLNPDVWQVAAGIGPAKILLALTLFAVVALLTGFARTREALHALIRETEEDPAAVPWPARTADGSEVTGADRRIPDLNVPQQINVALALTARQLAQALWAGAGIYAFLLLLGIITMPRATVNDWIGREDVWTGPVSATMAKVALLLAGFSMLYVIVVTTAEAQSRKLFFEPIARHLNRVLQVHAAYCAYAGHPRRLDPRFYRALGRPFGPAVRARIPFALADLPERWNPEKDPVFRTADPKAGQV
jgi:hypothetical protein